MKHISRLIAVAGIFLIALSAGCDRAQSLYHERLDILGTFAEITILGLTAAEAKYAVAAVKDVLTRLEHAGYTDAAESEVRELNDAISQGRSITVSPELKGLIETSRELYKASNGRFDPVISEPAERRVAETKNVAVVLGQPSMDDVMLEGNKVGSPNPAVKLDFGGMIRGYALERVISHLKQLNIRNALVDIGGSIRSLGSRGEHPWWSPVHDVTGMHSIGYVELGEDEAIFTVRQVDESTGKQGIDSSQASVSPANPPVGNIKAVTVIHANAIWANAAATSLLESGMDDWSSLAESMGVRSVMVIEQDGTFYTSTAMEERIHWNQYLDHQHLIP